MLVVRRSTMIAPPPMFVLLLLLLAGLASPSQGQAPPAEEAQALDPFPPNDPRRYSASDNEYGYRYGLRGYLSTYKPKRTEAERQQLCQEYKDVRAKWDRRDTDEVFAIRFVPGNPEVAGYYDVRAGEAAMIERACPMVDGYVRDYNRNYMEAVFMGKSLSDFYDTTRDPPESVGIECPNVVPEFQWKYAVENDTLLSLFHTDPRGKLEWYGGVHFCLRSYEFVATCGTDFDPDREPRLNHDHVNRLLLPEVSDNFVVPAQCPCGQDYYFEEKSAFPWNDGKSVNIEHSCVDINECMEDYVCPELSECVNTDGDYTCLCDLGYADPNTGSRDVPKTGECVYSPSIDPVEVTTTRIRMDITNVLPATVHLTLYQISDFTEQLVAVARHSNLNATFTSLIDQQSFLFDALAPGTRYQLEVATLDGETSQVVQDKTYLSPISITRCYCGSRTEGNGKPLNVKATQKKGYVQFQFNDNSKCEDAYSFSRGQPGSDESTAKDVFTSDYYYFSQQQCSFEPYTPGLQASDDLRSSQLLVGQEYVYLIRAAAKQPWRSSSPTTVKHVVRWQASVDGKVTLKESAGFLPVAGVTVQYRLEDLDGGIITSSCGDGNGSGNDAGGVDGGWCETTTSASGKFLIDLDLEGTHPSLNNVDDFPLRMRFSKSSGEINHRFLCDDATRDCTNQWKYDGEYNGTETDEHMTIVYLRHLDFEEPVQVIDDTTVDFRGKLTVAGTGMTGELALGCPLIDVQVCIINHAVRNQYQVEEPVCVRTSAKGEYALPAVIGMTISPSIDYFNHTFDFVSPLHSNIFQEGILIESNKVYEGYNLQDTTRAKLTIEVAGGVCDRVLGDSALLATMQGCNWDGLQLFQREFSHVHEVPAQIMVISVTSISGDTGPRNDILAGLLPSQGTIDLRKTEEGIEGNTEQEIQVDGRTTAEEGNETLQEASLSIRFQYNPLETIRINTVGTEQYATGDCVTKIEEVNGVSSYSYHVVGQLQHFIVEVFLSQEFGYNIASCNQFDEGKSVYITNQVGFSNSPRDKDLLKELSEDPKFESLINALQACREQCREPIDENGYASMLLVSGQPDPYADLLAKPILVTVEGSGVTHKAMFVVEGDYPLVDKGSAAFPTHKPLLVLRDPPGGESYAYYENVVTTIQVEMKEYEEFKGLGDSFHGSVGIDVEYGSCKGIGFSLCDKLFEAEAGLEFNKGNNTNTLIRETIDKSTATFQTTWSYQTSNDEWLAGKASDVFLVPVINVRFKKVLEVSFQDSTECADSKEKTKFLIDSLDNKPAIAFLSRFEVDNNEIPRLNGLRESAEASIARNNCPDAVKDANSTECIDFILNRDAAREALKDWRSFLDRHDNVTLLAEEGSLENVYPHEWFDKYYKGTPQSLSTKKHYSGLIEQDMANNAMTVDSGPGSTELSMINQIKFDGGGSELKFELKQDSLTEHTSKLGPQKDNEDTDTYTTIEGGGKAKIAIITFAIGREFDTDRTWKRRHHGTTGEQKETKIGFVLSDLDSGDVFDVDVFLDPLYGTFVFHTAGGLSRCPVEDGTDAREEPKITIKSKPSAPTNPEEPMLFEVFLTNTGLSRSSFQLFTDHRANTGLISHLVNGDTLTVPQQYDRLEPGETISTTIAIYRGPLLYDYPAIDLVFRSACENIRNIGDGNLIALGDKVATTTVTLENVNDPVTGRRIRFAEPCPNIEWGRELEANKGFVVRKKDTTLDKYLVTLIVRNPSAPYRTYSGMSRDALARLEDVSIWFRRKGTVKWSRALANGEEINLANYTEDSMGYVSVDWDVTPLGDGKYEVEGRTTCSDPSKTLPADLNIATTSVLLGVIDRTPPDLFGSPSPSVVLYPGQPIVFEFTELIECSRPHVFEIEAYVSTFSGRIFDNYVNDNLDVVCEGRSLSIAFNPYKVDLSRMRDSEVTVRIQNVQDLHGNPSSNSKPITHQLKFVAMDLKAAAVTFQAQVNKPCIDPATYATDSVRKNIASASKVPFGRVHVTQVFCTTGVDAAGADVDKVTVGVTLKPWSNAKKPQNRHAEAIAGYYNLLAAVENGDFPVQRLSEPTVVLGRKDLDAANVQQRRLLREAAAGSEQEGPDRNSFYSNVRNSNGATADAALLVEAIEHRFTSMEHRLNALQGQMQITLAAALFVVFAASAGIVVFIRSGGTSTKQ